MNKKMLAGFITIAMLTIPTVASADTTDTTTVTTPPTVNRLSGQSRIQTAVAIASNGWTQSDYAIIAYAWDFPDAVSAAPLAYKDKAPILLTDKDTLSPDTATELSALQVKHVIIVGGTGVVSSNVETQIQSKGMDTQRLAGSSRYETSVDIANAVGSSGTIILTNGLNPYEALSISPMAAKDGIPIILTARNTVPDVIQNYLKQNNITKTYVLGKADGTTDDDGIADNTIFPSPVRITGANVYERNINIIKAFQSDIDFSKIYISTGKSFADALTGSVLAAKTSSPIIFVDGNISKVTREYIASEYASIKEVDVIGGTGSVTDATAQELATNQQNLTTNGGFKTKLDGLVTAGTITQDQETAIVALFTKPTAGTSQTGARDENGGLKTKLDGLVTAGTITQDQETAIEALFTYHSSTNGDSVDNNGQ